MDIKVEGLNGQLPNLDLFNLATRMCAKEGIMHSFKNRENRNYRQPMKDWSYAFETMMYMVFTQATGIPNGNHGLFHRFGIQALTLEGVSDHRSRHGNFLSTGRVLESIFRSLNNLLERFHQSYFFYLLPSSDRFISIGLYIPSVCLIAGALFLKACGKWFRLYQYLVNLSEQGNDSISHEDAVLKDNQEKVEVCSTDINLIQIFAVLFFTHAVGILLMNSPKVVTRLGAEYNFNTEASVYGGFALMFVVLLLTPVFVGIRGCTNSTTVLHVISLLELGTALICLSIYNFSLGILLGTIYVPILLLLEPCRCRILCTIQKLLWIVVHPLIIVTLSVYVFTYINFPGDTFKEILGRGLVATQQAVMFSIVDFMIYSNWLYGVVCCVIIPNWLCFWIILLSTPNPKTDFDVAKKEN